MKIGIPIAWATNSLTNIAQFVEKMLGALDLEAQFVDENRYFYSLGHEFLDENRYSYSLGHEVLDEYSPIRRENAWGPA